MTSSNNGECPSPIQTFRHRDHRVYGHLSIHYLMNRLQADPVPLKSDQDSNEISLEICSVIQFVM
ncbi:hypothetical protein T4D_13195 [Trichinella pseudospiralis]|uniref:Uncharacterized protein n=1 Tax=Trichinella pseudospiralis TaxID=6337 RepID=A0A0V1FF41_TRIPS|nr:hypothetical protein T4D_13195 [Trichinella pseudospiralis]